MKRQNNKRERLIQAADRLIHQQGFGHTTLSDIAQASDVPVGNVYYYFRTKDDIGAAIVDTRLSTFRSLIDTCNQYPGAKQRLAAFLDFPDQNAAMLTEHGCPIGTLCYELSRLPDHADLHRHSKTLLTLLLDWSESQFAQLDKENARVLAQRLISELQGMTLIANAMEDPHIITSMLEHTRKWITGL